MSLAQIVAYHRDVTDLPMEYDVSMNSAIATMPRKKRSYAIDERVIDAIQRAARKSNMSANRYLEKVLFGHAQSIGELPIEAEPLGELRGGDFTSGKKGDRTQTKSEENN